MIGTIGPLVESVVDAPEGVVSASRTGADGDVAIGDLHFRLAITDQNQYQRATAQFRKDQLDAGPTPGDQSLTGWWTRGQFSFHKGSGVTYYEVEEGETVLNRYNDATGVNPFTPGAVTLCPAWVSATTDVHATTSAVGVAGSNLVVTDGGTVYYGALGGAGTTYTPSSSSVIAACTGNGDIYTANADKTISRIGLAEVTTTVYGEEGFESSAGGWTSNTAFSSMETATSFTSSTTHADVGTHALRVVWPAPGATGISGCWVNVTGLTVGTTYSFVCRVYVPTGSPDVRPFVVFGASGTSVTTKDAFTTCSVTFTATATSHQVGVRTLSPTAGTECYVDRAIVYRGSKSSYSTGTPIDVVYTSTTGLVNIFYAKDRLFVVDQLNTFYQLAPNPSAIPTAIAAGDKIFTVGGDQNWCCVDTPGPVLLGNGSRIFAVTVDSTGDIPTLSGPIQVADLPPGELVRALAFHLGFLVISTTAGIRVATVSDAGTVTYGPVLMDFASAPTYTSIARHGSRVVVAGDHKLFEIDLSEQIGDALEFGWTKLPSPFLGSEVNYGATLAPNLSVVAWSDSVTKYQSATSLTTSGDLTTGYHRFATLEPKRFSSVKLRASGAGGAITVSRVDADGTVTSLYTLDLASASAAEVGLQMNGSAEAIALKFTLTPKVGDATVGPTLLGYQLRALPEPERQRLIRIPLSIKDAERRQPARAVGRTGGAWERLSALEDLEASGASVQYQDFRTGENATVYIEQIEFTNMTPPTSGSSGFGGVAFITLRKL